MKLDKDLENEDIDKLISQDKGNIIENEVLEVPDYSYGANQEPLNAEYQVRNIPKGGKVFIGNSTISTTGTVSITGIGFTPKYVEITAGIAVGGDMSNSFGYSDGTNTYNLYSYVGSTTRASSFGSTNIITLYAPGSNYSIDVSLTSLDSDGFTLNGTRVQTTGYFIYKCFG